MRLQAIRGGVSPLTVRGGVSPLTVRSRTHNKINLNSPRPTQCQARAVFLVLWINYERVLPTGATRNLNSPRPTQCQARAVFLVLWINYERVLPTGATRNLNIDFYLIL